MGSSLGQPVEDQTPTFLQSDSIIPYHQILLKEDFSYCPLESYSMNIKDTGNQLFIYQQSYFEGHDLTTRSP